MKNDTEGGRNACNCKKRNGRHEETRTPDLYRVKAITLVFTTTYMTGRGCQVPLKSLKTGESEKTVGYGIGYEQTHCVPEGQHWKQSWRIANRTP